MTENELVLLGRYAKCQDAEAFEGLARRYAPLVYTAALRVTKNRHDAEEVAQICFLELAKNAAAIRSSVAGWLYNLAVHRARNHLRNERLRRVREGEVLPSAVPSMETTWAEIEPRIDEALAQLPKSLQEPILRHYLQGQSQLQIANELGLSQATVSRRIRDGIEQLRKILKGFGVGCTVIGLSQHLSQAVACEVPPGLRASLGKIAISGFCPTQISPRPSNILRAVRFPWIAALSVSLLIGSAFYMAIQKARVVRTRDIPTLQWGALHEGNTTYIGAIAMAARNRGVDTDYTRLMGDSGLAFCVRWSRLDHAVDGPSWQGLGAFGDGNDEQVLIENTLGLRLQRINAFGTSTIPTVSIVRSVRNSLNMGLPLIAQDADRARCCLIVGHDLWDPRRVLVRHYGDASAKWEIIPAIGGLVALQPLVGPKPNRRISIIAALRYAVDDWNRRPRAAIMTETSWLDPDATLFSGDQAWDEWARDTRRASELSEELGRQIWAASWWNYDLFCDARFQAAKYLKESAAEFDGGISKALLEAADAYDSLASEGLVDSVYQNPQGPWTTKTFDDWTQEVRDAELRVFMRVRAIDAHAMSALRAALQLFDSQAL